MDRKNHTFAVYLEAGVKKTYASAIEWPGWSRSGRDETSALQALVAYAPRYAAAMKLNKIDFPLPNSTDAMIIVERLQGGPETDFGVPGMGSAADEQPIDEAELARLQRVIEASWMALDAAVLAAQGKELRKGPRGGGRELESIHRHVVESAAGYLRRLVYKVDLQEGESLADQQKRVRLAVLEALAASARGEVPAQGPRGGKVWSGRYFTRRFIWHILDHAWEIEDRIL